MWDVRVEAIGNVKFWDDEGEGVFYSPSSGDTHLIDALAVELYELLRAQPQSETDLLHSLRGTVDLGEDTDAHRHLHEHLTRLQSIGLLHEQHV